MSRFDQSESGSSAGRAAGRLAGWQKVMAILSLVVTVGGGGLMAVSAFTGDAGDTGHTPEPTATSALRQGFAAGDTPAGADAPDRTFLGEWSPTIFRLGFSFFAAFCVAYALRSFLKLAIIGIGLLLIGLFALQYFDLIQVDWTEIGSRYDSVSAWIRAQTATFRTFIQGALPSSASAAVGLIAGFRRRG